MGKYGRIVSMKITYVSKTGKSKSESQDCILVNDQVINNYAGNLEMPLERLCIADGVGGVPGGYEASSFVLNKFLKDKSYKSGEELRRSLVSINDELIKYASGLEGKKAMATTFTGIARIGAEVWLMHAGNTRLYSWAGEKLEQLTTDHTNYQAMVKTGAIEPDDSCMDRNIIYCCFGTGKREYLSALQVEQLRLGYVPEYIILTSDGIHDHIDNERFGQILKENLDDRNKILALLACAEENGSTDDCTIVIARLTNVNQ